MWFPLESSSFSAAPGSLPAGGLRSPRRITLTRLRLVRSRTQAHSANCRPVLHTPDRNHRQDGCGFDGQRQQRGPRKQTHTPRCCHKYTRLTSVEQNKQKAQSHTPWTETTSGLFKQVFFLFFFFFQTWVSEMVEKPKWRPWLRFQRDMTIQCCNYMCCNALWITLVHRHIASL